MLKDIEHTAELYSTVSCECTTDDNSTKRLDQVYIRNSEIFTVFRRSVYGNTKRSQHVSGDDVFFGARICSRNDSISLDDHW